MVSLQGDVKMQALDTQLQAGLLWTIARSFGDPDADTIHTWLTDGAPAGISQPILDPGCIFPPDEPTSTLQDHQLPDPLLHFNYATVDEDEAAADEVDRLVSTGFVKEFGSLAE